MNGGARSFAADEPPSIWRTGLFSQQFEIVVTEVFGNFIVIDDMIDVSFRVRDLAFEEVEGRIVSIVDHVLYERRDFHSEGIAIVIFAYSEFSLIVLVKFVYGPVLFS